MDGNPTLASYHERLAIDRQLKVGGALVERMGLRRGWRVLEIGCGTGLLAEQLVDCVGPEGEVLGLDAMPLRVQIAHQRGRHNLRFQVGDPSSLRRFAAGSFDAVVANGVLPIWHDAAAALAECARLLAPGGCVGVATPSAAHPHPAERSLHELMDEPAYAHHPWPEESRRYPVSADELDRLLRQTGLVSLCVEARPETFLHATGEGALEHMQASAWGHFLMHLPPLLRASARAEILRRLEAGRGPDGIRHDAMQLLAIAFKSP